MTVESPAGLARGGSVPEARLEPNAIGVAQDTVIGMATAAPAASAGLILAGLAATTAYASGPALIIMALPMIVIANCYRRLNLWNANCGAAFEWVGRVINPYVGFLVGWLMIMGGIIGTVSTTVVLGPSVLSVFGSSSTAIPANLAIDTAVIVGMLVIAIVGIRITARTQVGMALVEYTILLGFAIVGLVAVISHHHGTFPITKGWFSLSGIGGKGSLSAGSLVFAVCISPAGTAPSTSTRRSSTGGQNPGRGRRIAVAPSSPSSTPLTVGLQGVVSPARLQANSTLRWSTSLRRWAVAEGQGMALSLALSVIATTGVSIVLRARVIYGMASHRVLPPFLGNVNPASPPRSPHRPVGMVLSWYLGLPAGHLARQRLHRAIDITALLYAASTSLPRLRHRLLLAPGLQQRLGRGSHRHSAPGRHRVPGLDLRQVGAEPPRRSSGR